MIITVVVANSKPTARPRKNSPFVTGLESRYWKVPDSRSSTIDTAPIGSASKGINGKVTERRSERFAARYSGGRLPAADR